jgi:hypothetical protein
MNQKTSTIVIVGMTAMILGGTFFGFYFGNTQGHIAGYTEGQIAGYKSGYPVGYTSGYSNGTKDGYNTGYTAGDSVGYGRGYNVGDLAGYNTGNTAGIATGYTNGYKVGNTTGYGLGEKTGYTVGYQKGWKATGFNIKDPTYQQMLTFIQNDKTDEKEYVEGSYVCHDFTSDVKRNAFNAGYRCFFVSIEMGDFMPTSVGHALVAFNTTDRGIVYIEPQTDIIMHVKVGQPYWDRTIYEAPSYDDTVTKIELIP